MKQRIGYIDVSKGILILLVIAYHSVHYPIAKWGSVNYNFEMIEVLFKYIMQPYKMAAFFIIHGMFSHFNKPLGDIIKNHSIKLILPMYILMLGSCNWFCWAMLWADICYWGLKQLFQERKYLLIITFIISLIAIVLETIFPCWVNSVLRNLYVDYAMIYVVFIAIGDNFKKLFTISKNNFWLYVCGWGIYFTISVIYFYKGEFPPQINGDGIWCKPMEYLPFLVLGVSGTLMILSVAKFIDYIGFAKLFMYIGLNSLVFYLSGFRIMSTLGPHIASLITKSNVYFISSVFVYIFVFLIITSLCWIANIILNQRCLKWIIGKFD